MSEYQADTEQAARAPNSLQNNSNNNSKIINFSFGNRSFQDEASINHTLSKHLGPEFLSERAGPGGKKVPYLEGI